MPSLPSLPGYRLQALIGAGPSGQVYRARDDLRGRDVAVKLLDPRRCSPRGLARLADTARTLAAIDGTSACEILDIVDDPLRPYVVMELLSGESLASLLQRTGPVPWRRIRGIASGLAVALDAAHDAGLVHGALKPTNVFLLADRLVVTDFGAHDLGDPGDRGTVLAVAEHLAPEQIRGEPVDLRADLYGLGLLLYELATGKRPFTGRPRDVLQQHLARRPAAPSSLVATLPPTADALVLDLLQKRPCDRPTGAGDILGRVSVPDRRPDGRIPIEEMPTVAWSRPPGQPDAIPQIEETLTLPNFYEARLSQSTTAVIRPGDPPPAALYAAPAPAPRASHFTRWPLELRLLAIYLLLGALLLAGLLAGTCTS
jgi:serine/threonine protein kinase